MKLRRCGSLMMRAMMGIGMIAWREREGRKY